MSLGLAQNRDSNHLTFLTKKDFLVWKRKQFRENLLVRIIDFCLFAWINVRSRVIQKLVSKRTTENSFKQNNIISVSRSRGFPSSSRTPVPARMTQAENHQ